MSTSPTARANPGHLNLIIFSVRGVGNLTGMPSGVGNLTFARVGWGKLNWKYQVSTDLFFFSGAEVASSYKHVFG